MNHKTSVVSSDATRGDTIAFASIFIVSFVLFMAVALLAQLLTLNWRHWLPVADSEKSLVDGVRSSVYAFMPYLT